MRHGAGIRHHRLAAVRQAAPAVLLAAARRARGGELRYAGRVGSGYSASGWTISRREFRKLRARRAGAGRAARPSPRRALSSSRSSSPRSSFAAGPMTVWFVRARSKDCVPTSRRPRSSGSAHAEGQSGEAREGGGEEGAEAQSRRETVGGEIAGRRRSRVRGRPRHPSRPRALRGAGCHQARPDRLLPFGRRPDAAPCRRPAAQPGALPAGQRGASASSRSMPRRAFPNDSDRYPHQGEIRHAANICTSRTSAGSSPRCRWARWNCTSGARMPIRSNSPTGWCSTSIPTKACRSPTSRGGDRRCASGLSSSA